MSYTPPDQDGIYTHLLEFGVQLGAPINSNCIIFQRAGRSEAQLELYTYLDGETNTGVWVPETIANYSWQLFESVTEGGLPGASAGARLFKDGVQLVAGTTYVPNIVSRRSNLIGGSNYRLQGVYESDGHFLGRIAEILVHTRNVSESERSVIENSLSWKWQVPLGH